MELTRFEKKITDLIRQTEQDAVRGPLQDPTILPLAKGRVTAFEEAIAIYREERRKKDDEL